MTQDKDRAAFEAQIELPPLVGTLAVMPDHNKRVIEAYGRACARVAIEHDRKGRGEPESEEVLWCLHILGPDDVHPAPSRAYAEVAADLHNARFGKISKASGVMCEAVVAPWPHSAESHAQEAGRFVKDWIAPQPAEPVTNAHTDDDAVDHFAAAMKEKLAQARAKGRHGWHECDPKDLSTMLRAHVEKGDPRDVANFCMFLWSLGQPISAAPQPAEPFLWYRPRPGAEAHADGRCYDIVFSDPHDTRFFPLYRNAPQPAEPEDEKLNLDRLADYISDNWPDKKYSLEEIARRLHATWPGAFMPAEPVKVESDAEPVCWWVTWDADNVGVAPIRAGLYMFETHEAAEKYVSKVMSLAKLDAKRPAIVPLYAAPTPPNKQDPS